MPVLRRSISAAPPSRGVVFIDYDLPGLKTVDGIASFGFDRVAWFRDPDDNLLALTQEGEGGRTG